MQKFNRIPRKSSANSDSVVIDLTDTFRIIHVEGTPGFPDAGILWTIAGQRADAKYKTAKPTSLQEERRF